VRIFLAEGEVPFLAGDHFSAADITALVTVDFATKAFNLPLPVGWRAFGATL
jgi:glutathione S-transferase